MKEKTYKAIIILGSDVSRIIDIVDNSDPDILVIGDGKKTTLKDLKKDSQFQKLKGRISPETNITIFAHGETHDKSHVLDHISTEKFLEELVEETSSSDVAMNIRLLSCHGGSAKLPNNYSKGSTLTTFAESDRIMFGNKYYKPLMLGDKTNSFESVLDNIIENANQTLTISTVTEENKHLRFVVRPPKKMLYQLDEIVRYFDYERNKIIQEYNDKVPKHKNLKVNSPIRPLLNDKGNPTNEALLMAKKWRARRFNYLMTDHNKIQAITSEHKAAHNAEYNSVIESLSRVDPKNGNLNDQTKQQQIFRNFVNTLSDVGTPAIFLPVIRGSKADVELFIKLGAEVNIRDDTGNTALHYSKNSEISGLLIANGCDVNAKNNDGLSPLQLLIKGSNTLTIGLNSQDNNIQDVVYELLKAGAKIPNSLRKSYVFSNGRIQKNTILKNTIRRLLKDSIESEDTKVIDHIMNQISYSKEEIKILEEAKKTGNTKIIANVMINLMNKNEFTNEFTNARDIRCDVAIDFIRSNNHLPIDIIRDLVYSPDKLSKVFVEMEEDRVNIFSNLIKEISQSLVNQEGRYIPLLIQAFPEDKRFDLASNIFDTLAKEAHLISYNKIIVKIVESFSEENEKINVAKLAITSLAENNKTSTIVKVIEIIPKDKHVELLKLALDTLSTNGHPKDRIHSLLEKFPKKTRIQALEEILSEKGYKPKLGNKLPIVNRAFAIMSDMGKFMDQVHGIAPDSPASKSQKPSVKIR